MARKWIKRDGLWSSYDPVIRKKALTAKRREIIAGVRERLKAVKARLRERRNAYKLAAKAN